MDVDEGDSGHGDVMENVGGGVGVRSIGLI